MTNTVQKWSEMANTAIKAVKRIKELEATVEKLEAKLEARMDAMESEADRVAIIGKTLAAKKEIAKAIAEANGITLEEIMSPTQEHWVAHPRQDAMRVMCKKAGLSYKSVGRFFGLHHTTVMYGVRKSMERETGK